MDFLEGQSCYIKQFEQYADDDRLKRLFRICTTINKAVGNKNQKTRGQMIVQKIWGQENYGHAWPGLNQRYADDGLPFPLYTWTEI